MVDSNFGDEFEMRFLLAIQVPIKKTIVKSMLLYSWTLTYFGE